MTSHAATLPQARGRLATTSIAELLVLALERRLSGSFVIEAPVRGASLRKSALVVASGRVTKVRTAEPVEPLGSLLTGSGAIDRPTLERGLRIAQERKNRLGDALIQLDAVAREVVERALQEQLGRRLSWLAELPEESAFGFYSDVDFLEARPECRAEPLSLIWRCMRDGRSAQPRQEAALLALGTRALGLRTRAALERFELSPSVRACIEGLSARPLALDGLLAQTGLDVASARRLVYALLITRQLEPQPSASMPVPSPPLRSTHPPLPSTNLALPSLPLPSLPLPSTQRPDMATAAALRPGAASLVSSAPARSGPTHPALPVEPAPSVRPVMFPEPGPSARRSEPTDRVEHALERASRLVRERTRAEGAAEAARVMTSVREHMEKKQFADAERLARAACRAEPSNAEHLALHAWLRMQLGELSVPAVATQIVAALDRAVMKAPMSVPVRFYRAQVLKRLGRDDEAYKDFRFVARRAPDQLDAVREVRLHLMRTRNSQKQSGVFSKLFLR
jgi:hypothetical protein